MLEPDLIVDLCQTIIGDTPKGERAAAAVWLIEELCGLQGGKPEYDPEARELAVAILSRHRDQTADQRIYDRVEAAREYEGPPTSLN